MRGAPTATRRARPTVTTLGRTGRTSPSRRTPPFTIASTTARHGDACGCGRSCSDAEARAGITTAATCTTHASGTSSRSSTSGRRGRPVVTTAPITRIRTVSPSTGVTSPLIAPPSGAAHLEPAVGTATPTAWCGAVTATTEPVCAAGRTTAATRSTSGVAGLYVEVATRTAIRYLPCRTAGIYSGRPVHGATLCRIYRGWHIALTLGLGT